MHNVDFHYKKMPPEQGQKLPGDLKNRQLRHSSMPVKSLEELLKASSGGGLGDVVRHARDMGDLVKLLQDSLPSEQRAAISAANIRDDGELVVLANSSAWASRLRYETEIMMTAARTTGKEVNKCSVRVGRG
jgi:hypothetical protein